MLCLFCRYCAFITEARQKLPCVLGKHATILLLLLLLLLQLLLFLLFAFVRVALPYMGELHSSCQGQSLPPSAVYSLMLFDVRLLYLHLLMIALSRKYKEQLLQTTALF